MKRETILLLIILIGAFVVRLYKFNAPVADWHSWRQVDTSAVSRNFVQNGFDVLRPRFDDLSKGVSLIDNPEGYRFVEFPIYNVLQAGLFKAFGKFTIEEWGRLVTIFFSLVSVVFLYSLVKKFSSARVGLFAAFFYAFIPYSIYYGRVLLPDQLMIAGFLGGLYFFSLYLDNEGRKKYLYYFLGIILFAVSLLIKPYVLFYLLPFLYLVLQRYGVKGFIRLDILGFFILTAIPFFLWRAWMLQYPAGIPRNNWLWNGTGIRFKPAFFRWIFGERIPKLILGYWGLPFVLFGFLIKSFKKENLFFLTFAASTILYFFTFATGNVQHDYYQVLIIPTLAIFFGKGLDGILRFRKDAFDLKISMVVTLITMGLMFFFSWYFVRDYYSIQHPSIIEAGQAVDKLTPKGAKVIAPYNGDTTFLYFTNRQGWPVFERTLKDFKKAGATYIAFADPTKEELGFERLFKPLVITKTYAIFDLSQPTLQGLKEQKKN